MERQYSGIKAAPASCLLAALLLSSACSADKPAASPAATPAPTGTSASPEGGSGGDATSSPRGPLRVKDIAGHIEQEAIVKLLASGAVNLDGEMFQPNEMIQRGEFLAWAHGYDPKDTVKKKPDQPVFQDVPADHPYADLLAGLKASERVTAMQDGSFQPDKELTREELAQLWGWYQRTERILSPKQDYSDTFMKFRKDGDKVQEIYRVAVDHYIFFDDFYHQVFGDVPRLNPQMAVTRAEAAAWIVKFYEKKES
ncbi:S-layer homology domain-containing protein [Paenibacillus sp. FJAT-26967]|uniref:S-layer homology domain-containing protein n=1 Tax=Paenibacillus sp. FJAT-26967 TaxID=1729690 RepID=UPI000837C861|nr:S-layer homology domain-containing protein [Paenibacillus sp. FJAT-26967]